MSVLRKDPQKKNQIHHKFNFKRNTFDIPKEHSGAEKMLWVIFHLSDPATLQKRCCATEFLFLSCRVHFTKQSNGIKKRKESKKKKQKNKTNNNWQVVLKVVNVSDSRRICSLNKFSWVCTRLSEKRIIPTRCKKCNVNLDIRSHFPRQLISVSQLSPVICQAWLLLCALLLIISPSFSLQWWRVPPPQPSLMASWRAPSGTGGWAWATDAYLAMSSPSLLCSPVQEMERGMETCLSACVSPSFVLWYWDGNLRIYQFLYFLVGFFSSVPSHWG